MRQIISSHNKRHIIAAVPRGAALTVTAALALSAAAAAPASAAVTATSHFVWTATSATTSGDSAFLDNGATIGERHDLVFVTNNHSPGGLCGCVSMPTPTGVWYDDIASTWAVFNENGSAMPVGAAFNVLVVPKANSSAFVWHATPSNTVGNHTFINSRNLNGKPGAIIEVTQDYNPGGGPAGITNPHFVGVRYYHSKNRWAIFNEGGGAIPDGAAFNVLVGQSASNGGRTAVLTTTTSDLSTNHGVVLSNRASNGDPNTVIFVTQDFNPGGKGGTADPRSLAVLYLGALTHSKAEVIDDDLTAPPLHSAFNLLIFSS